MVILARVAQSHATGNCEVFSFLLAKIRHTQSCTSEDNLQIERQISPCSALVYDPSFLVSDIVGRDALLNLTNDSRDPLLIFGRPT
jgi:hypothetical protein